MEKIVITKAVSEDIDSISELYDAVNTYFSDNVNYCFPNWQKGKYPVRRDALEALQKDTLFVLKFSGKTEGSFILDNEQHPEYRKIPWGIQCDDKEVMVMHTLVVNPSYRKKGLGEQMITYGINYCRQAGAKTLRLDTHYKNVPARRLYEKCGFRSVTKWSAEIDEVNQEFDVFEYIL